jgi:hypothetical protein
MSIPISVTPSLAATSPTQQTQSGGVGPQASLTGGNDPYAVNQIRYPLSGLGDEVPNYVVFYVNLPTSSKYIKKGGGAVKGKNNQSASTQNYDTLKAQGGTYLPVTNTAAIAAATELNTIATGVVKSPIAGLETIIPSALGAGIAETLSLRPKLTRIAQTVALYMPDTVATTYSHTWQTRDATDAYGDIARYAALGGSTGGVLKQVVDAFKTGKNVFTNSGDKSFNTASSAELISQIAQDTGVVGAGFTDLQLKSKNRAINPHAEMIFRATANRQYNMAFDLIPRSQAESVAIYNIIKIFKGYAAPEVTPENGGRYFIPPALWDIKFYFKNAENPTIARVSTCALENIIVNYNGGSQFATFDDGAPVHINIQLTFTEVDIMTRQLIERYGY